MLVVVSNVADDGHDTGAFHPERPARTRAAHDGLVDAGLYDALLHVPTREATTAELSLVHDPSYLQRLEVLCRSGGGDLDPDTPIVPGSWRTSLLSAGAGLEAVASLDGGRAEVGFVLTRPPGHHALPERGMGFCLLNNVAVTAAHLAERGERVLVFDWDVHHGNGTQAVFWDDPRVLFVSFHQRGLFPGGGFPEEVGGPNATGTTLNVPLPAYATGDVFRHGYETIALPIIEAFDPTWVLVSAGFDGHRADPLADLALTSGDYADLAASLGAVVATAGRLLFFLEGGYDLDALRTSVGAVAATALGERWRPEAASTGGPGIGMVDAMGARHRSAVEAAGS
jgi:acetoin utilization deacetylase AcuC-like enzyme